MEELTLGNTRGAAFLLAVYLAALTLLLLGGVSFQRTVGEARAAQISRDLQQAFWLSEASLDKAMMRMRGEVLMDGQAYPLPDESPLVPVKAGSATFQMATTHGVVIPPIYPKAPAQFVAPTPASQQLMRQITATGTAPSGIGNQVRATVQETGPLQGVWAKGLIVINGGREYSGARVFATGNLFSNFGSVVSSIPLANAPSSDPAQDKHANVLTLEGLTKAENADALETSVSSELMSLKNGYAVLEGAPKAVDDDAILYDVQTTSSTASEYVNGLLAIGVAKDAHPMRIRHCTGRLRLKEGEVLDIDDGFRAKDSIIHDLDKQAGHITLCVRSVVPEDAHGWGKVLAGQAPELRFHQPTTLYVTGSEEFDLATTTFDATVRTKVCPLGCLMPVPGAVLPIIGVQTLWRVSVGAKISTVDHFGYTIPNGISIIQQLKGHERTKWPGVMWVQPGRFAGSIYTPNSLVVVRARAPQDRVDPTGKPESLQLTHIVGNEVVVELDSDHLAVGTDKQHRHRQADANIKSWTN